jgi:hypothetical protein
MRNIVSVSPAEYHLELPTFQEDPAFYGYSRMKYIRHIMECCDPIVLCSARKPTLDEQEGSISYEN